MSGYSSLESARSFSYRAQSATTQNQLLDVANVRYVVVPAREPSLPSYRNLPFDPDRPIFAGGAGTMGGTDGFAFRGQRGYRLQVVAALSRAYTVPQGSVVAELTVVPVSGQPIVIPLRAGTDAAEWAYDSPDALGRIQHQRPQSVAFQLPTYDPGLDASYALNLYYSEHDLPGPLEVDRIDVQAKLPDASFRLYGLGIYDSETLATAGVTQRDRTKFKSVYRDEQIEVLENLNVMPKAYFVEDAIRPSSRAPGLGGLLRTPFDPRRSVLIEDEGLLDRVITEPTGGTAGAEVVTHSPDDLDDATYETQSPRGGYLVRSVTFRPGWRAWVDGIEAPILRANYLFQAIPLPPGSHFVEVRYEPASVAIGLRVTLAALALALVVVAEPLYLLLARRFGE